MSTRAEAEFASRHCHRHTLGPARRLLDRLTVYCATVTGAILLAGLVVSLVAICFVPHPNLGWSDNVALDAKAVATGHLQYGNPATEFVGLPYGPLLTFLFAGLLKIDWWEGWGPVLSIVAVAVAMVSLTLMLWTTSRRIEMRLASVSFVVALLLAPFPHSAPNGLFEARPDQLAWSLLHRRRDNHISRNPLARWPFPQADGSHRAAPHRLRVQQADHNRAVPARIARHTRRGSHGGVKTGNRCAPRKWLSSTTVLLTFVGSSALVGLALQLMSHGYAFDNMVLGQLRYRQIVPPESEIGPSLRLLAIPLTALIVLALAVMWTLVKRQRHRRHDKRSSR